MPWSLSRWNDGARTDKGVLEIECTPGRTIFFHGVKLQGPDFGEPEIDNTFALRQVCHLLVERIENGGLEEVCRSLAEFYEYYRPTETKTLLLPRVHTREAIAGTRSTKAPFAIDEE
jgi:hypothetical protein